MQMGDAEIGSLVKEKLKRLCCGNGWSYGAFWSFDHQNAMLLNLEDIYHEEEIREIVANMLQKVHMLGEGIVGQVASSGQQKWIFSDANVGGCIPFGSTGSQDISQENFGIHLQFLYGIKTIAVISVESRGVVQVGSTQKILERPEFINQTKMLFNEPERDNGLSIEANQASSLICKSSDLNEWFASFCNGERTPMCADSCNELMELFSVPFDLTTLDIPTEKTGLSNEPCSQFQPLSSQSAPTKSAANACCISTWSDDSSVLTTSESWWSSMLAVQDSPSSFRMIENAEQGCRDIEQNLQGNSFFSACQSREVDAIRMNLEDSGRLMSYQHSASSVCGALGEVLETGAIVPKLPEEFKLDEFSVDFSYFKDDLFEWLSLPEESINGIPSFMTGSQLPSAGVIPAPSSLAPDVPLAIPAKQPANSMQSSIFDAYSCGGVPNSTVVSRTEKDLFEGLGLESVFEKSKNFWEETLMVVENDDGHLVDGTCVSKCMSNLDYGATIGPRKQLFSELGLEKLFAGVSNCNYLHKSDDQMHATKRRILEPSSSVSSNQANVASVCGSDANMEKLLKSKMGLWIDGRSIMNAESAAPLRPKTMEEPKRVTRKRARPGEGTRPRPKDRQMILDRLAELKKIIPGGEKLTTDRLLDCTFKHLLFLQSVIKYAEKLKNLDEAKLLGQQNKICPEGNVRNDNGVTWALEVDDRSMVCPIIVEDIDPPGLMLIQMLCKDQGLFLEIADVIREFGLNILKGMTEFQEDKIWACFIVEAKANITRREVIYFLVNLLERNATGDIDLKNEPYNVMDSKITFPN